VKKLITIEEWDGASEDQRARWVDAQAVFDSAATVIIAQRIINDIGPKTVIDDIAEIVPISGQRPRLTVIQGGKR
jgi:hypothetical protein